MQSMLRHDMYEEALCRKTPSYGSSSTLLSEDDSSSRRLDDCVFSSKLSKMSLDERSTGLHDLHGVAELKAETPEMLQSKVKEMNQALASASGDTQVYKKAVSKSPEYVEHLKIPCLRAKEYNSEDAAALMIRVFNRKLELFGEAKLAEEIHMKDLTEEENDAIRKGLVQILPERDRAGRGVLFINGKLSTEYRTDTVVCVNSRIVRRISIIFPACIY
jgi:hypothetical protein